MKVSRISVDLAVVLLFVTLLLVPFMGKAFHMDEPFFLAIARQILRDPFHPLAFNFNWYGETVAMSRLNNTPPLMPYLLALGLKATGGGEWPMRLFLLPVDWFAAASLYLLAGRFLRRPLWPTLILIASPAYWINMSLLLPEKAALAFGLFALYALTRGEKAGWYWLSAAALGFSLLSKYMAIAFFPAALLFAASRVSRRRLAAYAALSLAPSAAYFLCAGAGPAAWEVISLAAPAKWPQWCHKLRSFLAFGGGAALVPVIWPLFGLRARIGGTAALAAALLFLPVFDIEPVRGIDRAMGFLLAAGALTALIRIFSSEFRRLAGWELLAPWLLAAAALQVIVYWAVLARIVLFMVIPMTLLLAAYLETRLSSGRLSLVYGASLGLVIVLGGSLSLVDYRYAAAQRSFARQVAQPYIVQGRRVWFTGHWGLQYYLEEVGAEVIDEGQGGFDQVKTGDIVLASRVNSNTRLPEKRPLSQNHVIGGELRVPVDFAIPLRLISGWRGQGGFYADSWGFLPYSFCREPLDEFAVGRHL